MTPCAAETGRWWWTNIRPGANMCVNTLFHQGAACQVAMFISSFPRIQLVGTNGQQGSCGHTTFIILPGHTVAHSPRGLERCNEAK